MTTNLDELLQAAKENFPEQEEESKDYINNTSVSRFVKKFNISNGDVKVPNYLIYYNYIQDKSEHHYTKVSKIEFFRQFKREYKQKRSSTCRYYLLSDCFDLTEEDIEKAKKYDKTYQK